MPNIRKKQTILKTVMYLFKYPFMYIYQDILDTKKALFCVIKGLFLFKRINLSHSFKRILTFFSQFFPVLPVSSTKVLYIQKLPYGMCKTFITK